VEPAYIIANAGDTTTQVLARRVRRIRRRYRDRHAPVSAGEFTTIGPWPNVIFTGAARDSVIAVRDSPRHSHAGGLLSDGRCRSSVSSVTVEDASGRQAVQPRDDSVGRAGPSGPIVAAAGRALTTDSLRLELPTVALHHRQRRRASGGISPGRALRRVDQDGGGARRPDVIWDAADDRVARDRAHADARECR
jgi:hypothetical protein